MEIKALIDEFVANLRKVIHRQVVSDIVAQVSGSQLDARPARGGRRAGAAASTPTPTGRQRRSEDQIGRMSDRLVTFLSDNPGARMEDISRALSAPTQQLRLPLNKMKKDGMVKTEGQKRATRYTLTGASATPRAKKPRGRKRKSAS